MKNGVAAVDVGLRHIVASLCKNRFSGSFFWLRLRIDPESVAISKKRLK
jgi:hypothetical protein